MCAAAHGWVRLGRIVYVCSSAQIDEWRAQAGGAASPVVVLPAQQVAPHLVVVGPVPELVDDVRALLLRSFAR